jgi:hypothetical protein
MPRTCEKLLQSFVHLNQDTRDFAQHIGLVHSITNCYIAIPRPGSSRPNHPPRVAAP